MVVFAFGVIIALVVAAIGVLALSSPSGTASSANSLAVYEELCAIAYGPPPVNSYIGTHCDAPTNPISMTTTYDLASVTQSKNGAASTLTEAYFAVYLASGQIAKVSISSSVPLDVNVFFDNRTIIDTQALANETVHGAHPVESSVGTKTFSGCLTGGYPGGQNEWYIFQILGGSPGQAATATFSLQLNSFCLTPPPQG